MANLNHRVFGSPIPSPVKQILEQRQLLAKDAEPNKSLWFDETESASKYNAKIPINFNIGAQGYYNPHEELNSLADLSSRTPFARMWTAVELHDYDKETSEEKIYDTETLPVSVVEGDDEWDDALDVFSEQVPNKSGYVGPIWDKDERKFYYKKIMIIILLHKKVIDVII